MDMHERERGGEEGGGRGGAGRESDRLGRHGEDARLRGGAQGILRPPPRLRRRQQPAPDQVLPGIEIPKYVDTVTRQYKPKFDALLVELKEAEKASLKESERIEKEIAEMQEMKKKIGTMTADEYFEKHPELKQKFDDEIRNDYWGY